MDEVMEALATLDPAFREKVVRDLTRIAAQQGPHGAADDDDNDVSSVRYSGNKAVALCSWALDRGRQNGSQLLEIGVEPGPVEIPKTRAATGRPVLSNGFLGADIIHVPAGEGFAPHTHPGDHLLFALAGRGTITASGEILETCPGQVYMVDGLTTHAVGAITDHVLLAIGVSHRTLDSLERQELRPFSELLAPEGTMTCGICDITATGEAEFAASGCPHTPQKFC